MEKEKEGRGFWGRLFGRTVSKPSGPEIVTYPAFPVELAKPVVVSTVDVEKIREKAGRVVDELAPQDTRKKFFYLVIDDALIKFRDDMRYFLEPLMKEEQNRDWKWVSEVELDGESGIALYKAFREADSQEHPTSIVIQIDGNLAPLNPSAIYRKGIQVAHKIAEISRENGWEIPLLVGGSVDLGPNEEIKRAYPDQYVGDTMHYRQALEAIKTRLSAD